jgi:hypothetical protein
MTEYTAPLHLTTAGSSALYVRSDDSWSVCKSDADSRFDSFQVREGKSPSSSLSLSSLSPLFPVMISLLPTGSPHSLIFCVADWTGMIDFSGLAGQAYCAANVNHLNLLYGHQFSLHSALHNTLLETVFTVKAWCH